MVPFPAKGRPCAVQACAIDGRVIAESFGRLSDGSDISRFAGTKDRREYESLTERSLEITGDERMKVTYIAELEVRAVLKTLRITSGGSAELKTEDHTALVVKPIARLNVHRIRAFESFYIAGIDAREEFVVRFCENFFRV